MDVILGYPSSPGAFRVAQRIGFQGIQVQLGRGAPGRLELSGNLKQKEILDASREYNIPITSTFLDVLLRDCLQSNPDGRMWVKEAIRATKALGAGMVELAFFFNCELKAADLDVLVNILQELAPGAERDGVILGVENTLSAADNMRLLDRVGSNAVKIWYDIGNSTNMGHFDVPAEIRALGKERICQIHIKDQVLLGTGKVDVKGAIQAMHDIGYDGWCVFETAASAADRSGDAEKNLKVFRQIEASTL